MTAQAETKSKHRVGECRVANYAEYGDDRTGWIIEQFAYGAYCNDPPMWALPAWDERGYGDLAGPFTTKADAERALRGAQ